jgi:uncharacterized membrane protein YeaQ/YmgE (transglycosylase-associated protein family)
LGNHHRDSRRLPGRENREGFRHGHLFDLLVGIVGAVLGGWVFTLLGLAAHGLIGQLVMATIGAILLLLIIRAIKRA